MAGSTFDVGAFAKGLVAPAREAVTPHLAKLGGAAKDLVTLLDELEKDTQATLKALEQRSDPDTRALLAADLELFLPARRDAILALAANKLGSNIEAALDTILTVVVKAAVIAAKSFI